MFIVELNVIKEKQSLSVNFLKEKMRSPFKKEEQIQAQPIPQPKEEAKEDKEVNEELGTIGNITQNAGFYVASSDGKIPCASFAEAKILSILLKFDSTAK